MPLPPLCFLTWHCCRRPDRTSLQCKPHGATRHQSSTAKCPPQSANLLWSCVELQQSAEFEASMPSKDAGSRESVKLVLPTGSWPRLFLPGQGLESECAPTLIVLGWVRASSLEGSCGGAAGALPDWLRPIACAMLVGARLMAGSAVARRPWLVTVCAVPRGHVPVRCHVTLGEVHVGGVVVVPVVLVRGCRWNVAGCPVWHLQQH